MATFTGWYYIGDQPTQEFTFGRQELEGRYRRT